MRFYPVALFEKYCTFKGRASRSEFWIHYFYVILISSLYILSLYIAIDDYDYRSCDVIIYVSAILFIFLTIPTLAVSTRRIHDMNLPGWFGLILFLFASFIVYYCIMMVRGTRGPNKFGPDPLEDRHI